MRNVLRTKELQIAILATVGIAAHLIMRWGFGGGPDDLTVVGPLYAVLVLGGGPLISDLLKSAVGGVFGADWLAGISIIASILLGEPLAGAIVVLMLSGGEALERAAVGRASSVLDALAKRSPSVAHRMRDDQTWEDIPVDEVAVGDALRVLPHEICPVDGIVLEGDGGMDESFLTGEPYRIRKAPGASVISGAINGDAAFTIRAAALAVDSRYARIMSVVREAEANRPPMRRMADQLGGFYTPIALAVAAAAWAVSGDPVRALAVLVVATPCPLLIAIPVALIGAISQAAKRGIIIRDPAILERLDKSRTLLLDKTGTLTVGRPVLTAVRRIGPHDESSILAWAASAEVYSKHPLAHALREAAAERAIALHPVSAIEERPGDGLRATVDGHQIRLLGRKQVEDQARLRELPPPEHGLESMLEVDGALVASLQFRDEVRADGLAFVAHLQPQHDVERIWLVSGDREPEVRALAERVGIRRYVAEATPEQKVEMVKRERAHGPTLFIGDGINDAPALHAADIGIALGQAHEATSAAAGAVILEPSLRKLDELLHIGRRTRRIALQSAVGGMALSVVGMALDAAGLLPPVAGAIAQEVIDLGAVLNALRVGLHGGALSDFGEDA